MQDPEIALKHANVISHACKLSGLLLASMLIRKILCGCVCGCCACSHNSWMMSLKHLFLQQTVVWRKSLCVA